MDKETNKLIKEIFEMYESMALDSNLLALIKVLKKWYFEKEDYKSRIDKAIGYIGKNNRYSPIAGMFTWRGDTDELINILRGEEVHEEDEEGE